MDNRNDGPIRISDIGSNTRQIESPNAAEVADFGQEPKKKTRGPSKLKMHDKGKQKCDEIDINEKNQPIEQESVHVSTLEGILAWEMVPININYWSKVPNEIKDKQKSEKFKKMREKQKVLHMMSRKGYARLEEDMKNQNQDPNSISRVDVWIKWHTRQKEKPVNAVLQDAMNNFQEIHKPFIEEGPTSIKDDAIVQAFGSERRGSVRGLGFGALSLKVDAQAYQNQNMIKRNQKLLLLEQELREMEAKMLKGKTQNDEPSEDAMGKKNSHGETQLHDTNETGNEGSLDNAKCKLLNWDGTKVVVAEGTIASIDSKALIHHVPLGPGCWKVWVNQVILNAPLFRLILGCVCLRMLLEVLFLGQHISLALTFSRNPNIYR